MTRINSITNEAYKDDPTILAWELINEPRCPSDPSGDTLQVLVFVLMWYNCFPSILFHYTLH
jgi:endo-1,4-beta-mannosidase